MVERRLCRGRSCDRRGVCVTGDPSLIEVRPGRRAECPQMLSATATGPWTVLPATMRLTRPCWVEVPAPPPLPGDGRRTGERPHSTGPRTIWAGRTAAWTPQTLAATAIATWAVLLVTANAYEPRPRPGDAGAAAMPKGQRRRRRFRPWRPGPVRRVVSGRAPSRSVRFPMAIERSGSRSVDQ
jgi:hypothetical protein